MDEAARRALDVGREQAGEDIAFRTKALRPRAAAVARESLARSGDKVEDMAYGGSQLEEFSRRLEKLLRRGVVLRAIRLSGGGNDIAILSGITRLCETWLPRRRMKTEG